MKRRITALFAATLMALSMMAVPALAEDGEKTNNGVRCSVSGPIEDAAPGNIVANPAAMFEFFGDRGNPVDAIAESGSGWTVGEWIQGRCAAGNSGR